jgi:transcriptional regulator with XRE-family HTH domain
VVAAIFTPDPADVHVGARLRLRRLQFGMSQESLAGAIGVTFQQVPKYERPANRLSAFRLVAAARTLSVPPGYFFEQLPGLGPDSDAVDGQVSAAAPLMTPQSLELASLLSDIDPKVGRALLGLARVLTRRGEARAQ